MQRWSRVMTLFVLTCGGLASGVDRAAAGGQVAAPADEVAQLRLELASLRQDYAARLAALEARLAALEAGGGAAPATEAAPVAAPVAAASEPLAAVPAGASKVFNPDMAAIGNFVGAAGKSPGGGEPSLNMQESELSFQAVVDPYARADFFVTVGPDEVALEEGYLTFPTLPGGFLLKVGKLRDAFGKVNGQHAHVLPFVDRPLVAKNLLGGEDGLADSGISLARLIPNPWLFLEATGQVYRGESSVFKAPSRGDLAYVGHLRAYRDVTESTNLDLGGSIAYGHNGVDDASTTRLLGADLTLRYRPLRRSIYTSLIARGELAWSRRQAPAGTVDAFGAYGYLEYQFARRWSAGLRYDSSERAGLPGVRDKGGSFIVNFRPSEFSLVRTQLRRTSFGDGATANELLFQFLFAIGAHGAHPF